MGKDAGNVKRALRAVDAAPRYRDSLGRRKYPDVPALAEAHTARDRSVPNASSIVLLAEYRGKSCLFAGDTNPDILESAVDRLLHAGKQTRLHLDALKVPHHGSRFNVTADLIQKLNCRKFLISTNGVKFEHPDPESIARIILYGGPSPELYFNYATPRTLLWDEPALKRRWRYKVVIRSASARTLDVDV